LVAHAPAEAPTAAAYVAGFISLLLTGVIAAMGLYARRAPGRLLTATEGLTKGPIKALRAAHSGHVGDYVAWLTLGCALLGAAMAGVFT
jgi:multicomponent Na+:H+ antiporter subunit D